MHSINRFLLGVVSLFLGIGLSYGVAVANAQSPDDDGSESEPVPVSTLLKETSTPVTANPPLSKTPPPAAAKTGGAPKPKKVSKVSKSASKDATNSASMNLPPSIDLDQFIKIISAETNTVFLYDEKDLKGKTSIIAPPNLKMKPKDAMLIFERLMDAQGLTMVRKEKSNVVEIVQSREARFSDLPVQEPGENVKAKPTDSIIQLIPVRYADLNKIKGTLSPVFSKNGVVLTYDPLNLLIFIDSKANIQRIENLIELLDVPESEAQRQVVTIHRMRHNQAQEIHRTVSAVYSNLVRNGKREEVKFIIDNRLNALLIITTQELTDEVEGFIEKIDIPLKGMGATLTLHELQYGSASTIAPILSGIFSQPSLISSVTRSRPPEENSPPTTTTAVPPSEGEVKNTEDSYANGSVPIKIIPFDKLNALIIIATPDLTSEILELVKQLDVDRGDVQLMLHPLKYASAQVLAPLLSNIFSDQIVAGKGSGGASTNSRTKIIAETRLNSLILIADSFSIQRIISLINDLDVVQGDSDIALIPLKYAAAKDVAPILTQIFANNASAPKDGLQPGVIKIIPITRLNALIVIGDQIAARQVQELLQKIDVEQGDTQLSFYRLKFSSANTLGPLLRQVFTERGAAAGKEGSPLADVKIFPEPRLNALIILAGKQESNEIYALLEELDVPAGGRESNLKIYSLQYAVASDMAKMLKDVTKNIVELSDNKDPQRAQKNAESGAAQKLDISITVDEATNSLLVFAPADVFETIGRIVAQLDVPRPQVYVEALIVEVTLEKSLKFGVDWVVTGASAGKDAVVSGGTSGAAPLTVESAVERAGGSQLGVVSGSSLDFNGKKFLSFGAFIQANQNDSEINVLSNPQLLMLNNEQATINVSNVIPVATNSSVDANGRVTDQIDFRDIGVILTIKPQISGDDSIRLQIQETFSNVVPSVAGSTAAVTTLKRELKTTIVTADDSIVVLGGLLTQNNNESESKIPGLGDLPLLGWLFSSSSSSFSKTNLLLFIRPRIIRTRSDLVKLTQHAQTRYNQANTVTSIVKDVVKDASRVKEEDSSSNDDSNVAVPEAAVESPQN